MKTENTILRIDWSPELALWVFKAERAAETWAWTITPEQYLQMLDTLQTMQDQLNCALGAKVRNNINTGDE